MKPFNLFILILWTVTLYLSWSLSQNSSRSLSWQSHASIQMGLRQFVTNHIKEKLPNATNIEFISLWSKHLQDTEIKVFFEYQFQHPLEDDSTQSQLKGWALLDATTENLQESWTIKNIQIDQQSIQYTPETIIIPSSVSPVTPSNDNTSIPNPTSNSNAKTKTTPSSTPANRETSTTLKASPNKSPEITTSPAPNPGPTPSDTNTEETSQTPDSSEPEMTIPDVPPMHLNQ